MTTPPAELVRIIRSGFHEGSHYGSVVITDPTGAVRWSLGDVTSPMFPRSTNKPFQAMAMVEAGTEFSSRELAIAAASHAGEPFHVSLVRSLLARGGFTEDALQCPADLPGHQESRWDVQRSDGSPERVYMNCSGKHAAMLLTCRTAGWDTENYLSPDHPLQRATADVVTRMARENHGAVGIDGCGAPLYALSLVALARGFGAIAAGREDAAQQVSAAMRAHPELVGGTGQTDTRLMAALPDLLVKTGAEGVHCAALPDGSAVALKITDGADRARLPVLVAALRRMGLEHPLLDELAATSLLGGATVVGRIEAAPGLY